MNELIDKLLPLERELFLALNGSGSVFWDNAMWTFTGIVTWIPLFFFILYIAFKNQQTKEGLLVLLCIVLVLLFSQIVSTIFFKPLFKRYRPTHHPLFMDSVKILNDFRGEHYGFISGHATSSFALAMFFTKLFRNRLVALSVFIWATLNSYSRIYLGVHFISDIIAGLIFGLLIGIFVYNIYVWIRTKRYRYYFDYNRSYIYTIKEGNILAIGFMSYMLFIIIFSPYLVTFSHSIIPQSWF